MRLSVLSLAAALAALVSGCTYKTTPDPQLSARDAEYMKLVPQAEEDRIFARYLVDDPTGQPPGTIVVDTTERFLYLVLPDRKAMRYGVAVGDEAYGWTGTARVARKAEWPDWTPPPQMLKRRPDLPRHMKGGLDNPLGARAMYLGGTLFRIHGSNEPDTIGQAVSSGCIRMTNDDVVDLYERVKVGTRVVVL